MSSDPTSEVQKILNNYVSFRDSHVGAVAGIISPDVPNGSTLLSAGGATLWNTQHKPMSLDGDTQFEIASVTKTFTSWVHYKKYQNYHGTLGEFITAPPPPAPLPPLPPLLPAGVRAITIANLASYSPGFPFDNGAPPHWWATEDVASLKALSAFLSNIPKLPQQPQNTYYSYSNLGWSLLALAAIGVTSVRDDIVMAWTNAISALQNELGMSTSTAPYNKSMDRFLPVGYSINRKIFGTELQLCA